jgi:hypothetical protein
LAVVLLLAMVAFGLTELKDMCAHAKCGRWMNIKNNLICF